MRNEWPEFYFRFRGSGAAVFRVEPDPRSGRVELRQIAAVNLGNGKINPHGGHALTDMEHATITAWRDAQTKQDDTTDEISDTAVKAINHAAHWAQADASPEALEAVTTDLLLAMHDLRSVLVRKKAERLSPAGD